MVMMRSMARVFTFKDGDNGDGELYRYRYEMPLNVVLFPRKVDNEY